MKNTDPLRRIRAALLNAKTIEPGNDTFIITFSGTTEAFSRDEVSAVDPRLLVVIDHLLDSHPTRVPEVVRQTMSHWADPQPPQEGVVNSRVCHPTFIQQTDGDYYIRANRYKIETIVGGIEIAYPTNKNAACMVSEEWLNRYYPKATIKVKLLQDMGMTPAEISKLALAEIDVSDTQVDMNGVSFS